MKLSGLGEIQLVGIGCRSGDDVTELLGEAKSSRRVVQELGRGMEIGELDGLGLDRFEGVGELGSDPAERRLEG